MQGTPQTLRRRYYRACLHRRNYDATCHRAPRQPVAAAGESLRHAMLAVDPEAIVGATLGAQLIHRAGDAEWLKLGWAPALHVRV